MMCLGSYHFPVPAETNRSGSLLGPKRFALDCSCSGLPGVPSSLPYFAFPFSHVSRVITIKVYWVLSLCMHHFFNLKFYSSALPSFIPSPFSLVSLSFLFIRSTHVWECIYVQICVTVCTNMYVCVFFICICVYVYTYTYIYMYGCP